MTTGEKRASASKNTLEETTFMAMAIYFYKHSGS